MKIILDESVPQRLRLLIEGGHMIGDRVVSRLVRPEERSVAGRRGIGGFDLLITADQEMSYRQNLTGRKMALVVLSTNNWSFIKAHISAVMAAVDAVKPGSYTEVEIPFV